MNIRRLTATIGILGAIASPGCTPNQLRDTNRPAATKTDPRTEGEVDKFFLAWNANAQKIRSIRCDNVNIDGKSQGQPYTLNAKVAFEKDNRFRLVGKFAGKSQVDLGSNEDEIWFWIAKAEPPAVYFCKRSELNHVKMATPFQPDWLIEAMGVATLNPRDYQPAPSNAKFLALITQVTAPNGQTLSKRILIDRKINRIYSFELFDPMQEADKRLVARVAIQSYEEDQETGTFVPRVLELEWPGEADTKLSLMMSPRSIQVNRITPETAQSMFARSNLDDNPQVDLARPSSRAIDREVRPANRAAALTGQIEP